MKKLLFILTLLLWQFNAMAQSYSGGAGTIASPIQIATLADIIYLSNNPSDWAKHFRQTANIDASSTSTLNAGAGFSPIGNATTQFRGSYNGGGNTITGLVINRPTTDYVGLFGYPFSASISNLGMLGGSVSGKLLVGSLVGFSYSMTVTNSYATGSVSGAQYVGGLVGFNNNSTITNSYATGSVSATGNVASSVGDCVGGLVGYSGDATITNSYATGSVSGTTIGGIGGLVGLKNLNAIVNSSYWNTITSGQTTSAGGTGRTTAQMQTQATFVGWDFVGETTNGTADIWKMDGCTNNGYPILSYQTTSAPPNAPFVDATSVNVAIGGPCIGAGGLYNKTSVFNGKNYYTFSSGGAFIYFDGAKWVFGNPPGGSFSFQNLTVPAGMNPPLTGWTSVTAGCAPGPFSITSLNSNLRFCSGSTIANLNIAGTGIKYYLAATGGTALASTDFLVNGTYFVSQTIGGCESARTAVGVTVNSPLVIPVASQTNVSCNGGSNGSASVTPSGGAGGYTYSWSPSGGAAATATGLAAGTYTVTVTDAIGCIVTRNFTITQPTALVTTAASQTNVSCNGGSNGAASINIPTGGAGGYTYNWTPGTPTGDGTRSVTGLSAGTWTCTITDANSCTTTVNFTITQPTAISTATAAQTNVSCNGGSNGSASVTPSGGAGGYTYSWSPSGGTAATATGLSAGTYTVTVTDANACTATRNFTITQPTIVVAPTGNAVHVYVGNAPTLASITVTGSAIKWYDNATGGTELPTTTTVVNNTTYYASQTITSCESTTRLAVKVRRISEATQTLCSPATVANLVTTPSAGSTASWFANSTGGTELINGATLNTGNYYVQQSNPLTAITLGPVFNNPRGVAVQTDGKILICGDDGIIKRMNADGTNVVNLASGFYYPNGIAIQADGKILVADSNSVKRINADGSGVTTFLSGAIYFGIVVQADGKIVVSDNENSVIKRMNADGTNPVTVATGFNRPRGIAMQADGSILIADTSNNVIKRMNADGTGIVTIASGLSAPTGITVQANGKILFTDDSGSGFKEMNADGTNIVSIVTPLFSPWGITVQSDGAILIADTFNNIVKRITNASTSNRVAVNVVVNPTPLAPTATAQQFLPAGSTVANLTAAGSGIQWYTTLTTGTALANATPLVNGTTYFASQTVGICESTRIPVQVTITANNVAINFDGTNDFMRVPNNASINFTTNMTVEFWVRTNANTFNYNYILGKANSGSWTNGFNFTFSGNDKINFAPQGWTGNSTTNVFQTSTIPVNTWTHVAGTYDGTTANLYINGFLDTSIPLTGPIPTNAFDLFIGADNGVGYPANYDIDMVRLWNTARTQAQIAGNLNNCVSSGTAGLVAQYDFEEAPTSVAFQDTSSNSFHGSYNNMETPDWITGATCATTYVACAPIAFANASATDAVVGASYNLDASVTGNTQSVNYTVSPALPSGLAINPTTGIISGTPTALSTSTTYTVTATTQGSCTRTQSYSFEVVCPTLVFGTTSLPDRDYNQLYSQSLVVSNATTALTYTISSGSLPAGFSLSTSGTISGTSLSIGTFTFTVLATDVNGCSASQTFSIGLSQIPITVTANAQTKVFGTTDPVLTYTVVPSLQPGDSFTGALSRVAGENVGTYAINQGTLSAGPNYIVTYVGANFTITKASQTITWVQDLVIGCDDELTYSLNATSSSGLAVNYTSQDNSIATITGSTLNIINQGSVNIIATQSGNANFDAATNVIQTVVVSQSGLIRKHWRDVIFFDNSSNDYSGYQWYKNGVLVANANQQYFKESGNLSGTYYATAFKNGALITTCTLTISDNTPEFDIKVFPNPASAGATFEVETTLPLPILVNAKIEVYNQLSALLSQSAVTGSKTIVATPLAQGVYIVRLTLSNGNMYSINLLVK
ncbi:LamG-like jellyroll fold domain-containing protein [Flavobacterium sp.]|uniref:LamG-like jellyroll fold domain-containing protein n=1 Tax=Flavobacterium sp. TaxID=239 RepID=UPI00286EAF4F|nr:LamG-like jellyroll fold domain-containing protein [Flavobacterium sp.]